jgi:hypothetical protein
MPVSELSHLGADGRARMVDVGDKPVTARAATACSPITDARGTAEYRRQVVAVLVPRALHISWLRATGSWPAGVPAPINGVLSRDAA